MLLTGGFPGLGHSVLSGTDSLQESLLKRSALSRRLSPKEMQTSVHVTSEWEAPQDVQTAYRT